MKYHIREDELGADIGIFDGNGKQLYNAEIVAKLNESERLREACQELLDAPHYEHFAVRLNDEEMKAFKKIEAALQEALEQKKMSESTNPVEPEVYRQDKRIAELEAEVARWKNLHEKCLADLKKSGRESDALAAELRRIHSHLLDFSENLQRALGADSITNTLKEHGLDSEEGEP